MFPLQTFIFFFCFCLFRSSIISNFVALFAWFYACPRKKVSYSFINTLKISNVSNFLLSKTIRSGKVLNVSILWKTFRCCSNFCHQPDFKPSPLGNLCTGSKGLDHWTTSDALCFQDWGRALLTAPPKHRGC